MRQTSTPSWRPFRSLEEVLEGDRRIVLAWVPGYEGCRAQGANLDEALAELDELFPRYLRAMRGTAVDVSASQASSVQASWQLDQRWDLPQRITAGA